MFSACAKKLTDSYVSLPCGNKRKTRSSADADKPDGRVFYF